MSGTVGCLLIHGFAGDINDILPLAKVLREAGYQVECPTLEGHGTTRRQMARSTRNDWLRSAEEGYKRLSMRAETIVIIGFSMGGLLAFHLTTRYPVELLITINTPYKYWDVKEALHYLREDFPTHSRRYIRSIGRIPVSSMLQFRRLLSETKPLLRQVKTPYYLLQAMRDDTVHAVSAQLLATSVDQSASPQITWYEHSNHMLLHGPDKEAAIHDVLATLKERFPDSPALV
ncbi:MULTISPECIES: alpha/beta hydrolase [Brevibacillus]|jgi:carboxylesterase|uniref:Carboxylesterase n=1 Tax=Brevibacillus parabrevis TaxID=54914 RepID=A0A4Y3PN20_BREPA|nr:MULTISPECIES: alpha/beta fold hydrolase [Brevibacillus]MBU8713870.1 alpha/beta fold hydrolase [Brevibacillus parabrevis]MDH6350672.1 carboxylesterase [Brevibacillus sp. 1238]MDR4998281.1 alpha/beta fold hydrolase [Brevibacillus parabrevis]MED2255429.1 alpha/beta fold hydrolase [Brevibacillus parabrevis]NRQ54046.1 alpha/beta fold hydrolase [Brevibacillus sp. HD1.4A]